MKKFIYGLFSDSNKVSSKRFIGIIAKVMFVSYGVKGLINPFNLQFSVFYVSLCCITVWIAFKFMSSEKALKYNVLGQMGGLANLKEATQNFTNAEKEVDNAIEGSDQKSE